MNHTNPAPASQPPAPGDKLINATEVARILGGDITERTVIRRWRKWGLHPHRIGRQLRWWQSTVYQWISDHPA